jgi:hypothetical protein
MEIIKNFFQRKDVRTWFWGALDTILGIFAIYLGDLDPKYLVVIVPTIIAVTKYINKKYL